MGKPEPVPFLLVAKQAGAFDDAYFVYANALKSEKGFFDQLKFKTIILKHVGDTSWVDSAVSEAHRCLVSNEPPPGAEHCSFCKYRAAAREAEIFVFKKQD